MTLEDDVENLSIELRELIRHVGELELTVKALQPSYATCDKCGQFTVVRLAYLQGREYDGTNTCVHSMPVYREHMHKTCQHCGYQWIGIVASDG